MSAKTVLLFCMQVLLMKTVLSQCIPSGLNCGLEGLGGLGLPMGGVPYGCNNGNAQYGSPYGCNNGNPFANIVPPQPVGVSISADNLIIEGLLDVAGNLPFVGTVVVDSVLPSRGQVQASYSCGNGNIGINDAGLALANAGGIGYNLGQSVGINDAGLALVNAAGIGYNLGPTVLELNRGCGCM